MNFNRSTTLFAGTFTALVLSACQHTPVAETGYGSSRAAYSEWNCAGEAVLAQFYGARVVVSDSSSSRWLDRGTQVGQVFRGDAHSIRFRDDTMVWTQDAVSIVCTPRELPAEWQHAAAQRSQPLHFVAEGPQQRWTFKLQGQDAAIVALDDDDYEISRQLPVGVGDYYLDMWTFNIQTPQDRMRIEITDGLCRNLRDAVPYPSSIQINWNDQVLQGCGRWLAKSGYRP